MEPLPDIKLKCAVDSELKLQVADAPEADLLERPAPDQKTLRELLNAGPMSSAEALEVFIAVCDALVDEKLPNTLLVLDADKISIGIPDDINVSVAASTFKMQHDDTNGVHQQIEVNRIIPDFGCLLYESIEGCKLSPDELPTAFNGEDSMLELSPFQRAFHFRDISGDNSRVIRQEILGVVNRCVSKDPSRYQTIVEVRDALRAIRDLWTKKNTKKLDKPTVARLMLWLILGLIALFLLSVPDPPEFQIQPYYFPISSSSDWASSWYNGGTDADSVKLFANFGTAALREFNQTREKRRDKYLAQYPPDEKVHDIVDWRTRRVIYHSDRAVSRTSLFYRAVQEGACLRGAELRHLEVDPLCLREEDPWRRSWFAHQKDPKNTEDFQLRGLDFRDVLLSDCCFWDGGYCGALDMSGCDFRGATIKRTKIGGILNKARFDRCVLENVGIAFEKEKSSHFADVSFNGAELSNVVVQIPPSDTSAHSFKNCRMKFVRFAPAGNVDFTGSHICHGDFTHVDLREANFSNAVLFRCSLVGAMVAGVKHDGLIVSGSAYGHNDVSIKNWSSSPAGWVYYLDDKVGEEDWVRRLP